MMVTTSQFWGRRSQSLGRKPVLVAAFTLATAPTAGTALYAVAPALPVVIATAILVALAVFLVLHPRFRTEPAPLTPPA